MGALLSNLEHAQSEIDDALPKLNLIVESLKQYNIFLEIEERPTLHDRSIQLSNGWMIRLGRG